MISQQNNLQIAATSAVIYARFSSHNQREESIEQQVAECRAYAAANGLKIIDTYADSAKSGRTDRRAQFQKLQRDAKKGKFQTIIAYKSNRIARNMLNAMIFESEMEQIGIKVLYAKEEFGNTAAGRFALRTMMNVNQFFSENMGEDIKRNQADNAQNCRANGPASFGYKVGADGKFVINEDEAPIVKEIFEKTAEGDTFTKIKDSLNSMGIRTRRGGMWTKSSFYNILHNERYIGYYIFDEVKIEGGMPQIVSKELFYKVQERLKKKKNPQGRVRNDSEYLLTGKLFCCKCGDHMIGMSGTSRSGTLHHYYVCNDKRSSGNCDKKNVRRDAIEKEIARGIKDYILQPNVISWMADTVMAYQKSREDEPDYKILKESLSDVKKSIKNIVSAIEQGIFTSSTKARLDELEAEQKDLTAKLAVMNNESFKVTREQIVAYFESYKDGNIEDIDFQRMLFDTFVTKIFLFDDHVKIIFDIFGNGSKDVDIPLSDLDLPGYDSVRLRLNVGHQKEKTELRLCFFFLLIRMD
ncbi:MAG: recombinase family protein [Clostridia bacterium]|nr:recombinase family protein [Clostridia bacterium]